MPKASVKTTTDTVQLRLVPLEQIMEPSAPIRQAMDRAAMDELCESMTAVGLLQPIGIFPVGRKFEIAFGHRRFVAACRLRWSEIRALVFTSKEFAARAALMDENFIREDVSTADEALFFAKLLEDKELSEESLCKMVRRSPAYIADRLMLLRRCPKVFAALQARLINFGVARELNKVTEDSHRAHLLDCAVRGGATHALVSSWVADWKAQQKVAQLPAPAQESTPVDLPPVENPNACKLCGGFKDPYNIIFVPIHRHEWDALMRVWEETVKRMSA